MLDGGLGLDGDLVLLLDLEGDLLCTERCLLELELLDAPAGEESSPCLCDVKMAWPGCRGGGGSVIKTLLVVVALWDVGTECQVTECQVDRVPSDRVPSD